MTIIDDDEPGVIAFQAPKEGCSHALPPVTAARRPAMSHCVGRFNGANGEVHVDCKFVDGCSKRQALQSSNHPITFIIRRWKNFWRWNWHTGLEDGVEFQSSGERAQRPQGAATIIRTSYYC